MSIPLPGERSGHVRRFYWVGLILVVLAVLALSQDLWVVDYFRQARIGREIRKVLVFSEVFAHGLGVGVLLVTILVLEPQHVSRLPRMLACTFGSGMMANFVKMLVGRQRPRSLEFDSVWDTFVSWVPAVRTGELRTLFDSRIHSFPSAHAATAFGFAVVLVFYCPRGRWLFLLFAAVSGVQRLYEGAHFLSDTLIGAAIGCVVAAVCCDQALGGGWFDRFEASRGPAARGELGSAEEWPPTRAGAVRGPNKTGLGDLRSAVSAGSETRAEQSC